MARPFRTLPDSSEVLCRTSGRRGNPRGAGSASRGGVGRESGGDSSPGRPAGGPPHVGGQECGRRRRASQRPAGQHDQPALCRLGAPPSRVAGLRGRGGRAGAHGDRLRDGSSPAPGLDVDPHHERPECRCHRADAGQRDARRERQGCRRCGEVSEAARTAERFHAHVHGRVGHRPAAGVHDERVIGRRSGQGGSRAGGRVHAVPGCGTKNPAAAEHTRARQRDRGKTRGARLAGRRVRRGWVRCQEGPAKRS